MCVVLCVVRCEVRFLVRIDVPIMVRLDDVGTPSGEVGRFAMESSGCNLADSRTNVGTKMRRSIVRWPRESARLEVGVGARSGGSANETERE
jgi:hypothetical protein